MTVDTVTVNFYEHDFCHVYLLLVHCICTPLVNGLSDPTQLDWNRACTRK